MKIQKEEGAEVWRCEAAIEQASDDGANVSPMEDEATSIRTLLDVEGSFVLKVCSYVE
jgi:hypothetical protein